MLTVIIPTFNRRGPLTRCLRALGNQSYHKPFEVIVVNDGGADLAGLAPDFSPHFNPRYRLRLINQTNSGPATARNAGALAARGGCLIFTDDDVEPSERWLEEMVRGLEADPKALVGGRTINALPDNPCSNASQLLIDFLYRFYKNDGVPRFFTSNNMAVSRRAFLEVGGFDESFPLAAAEDRDFCARWRHSQRPMRYAPEAAIYHAHYMSLAGFVHQHFQYGRGACQFWDRRAAAGEEKLRVERIAFYASMLRYPWTVEHETAGRASRRTRSAQSLLLAASQAANASGWLYEKVSGRRPRKQSIPLGFNEPLRYN